MTWHFNSLSVPAQYDPDEVLNLIERAFDNVTQAHNDCGLPDLVDASHIYQGTAILEPCGRRDDGRSLVGFGEVPNRIRRALAATCPWAAGDSLFEADIVINPDVPWALSADECVWPEELLEATLTHEIGHLFGLGHVSERRHGDLTMSTRSNGPCSDEEVTLGLGDVLGLEELYPAVEP